MPTDILEHPAVKAWSELQPLQVEPEGIETLKRRKGRSWVYRLSGVGPEGSAVIAKRRWRAGLLIEGCVYKEVLPHLNMPTLRYFGFVDEPDGDFSWIFVEDAGGAPYCPLNEAHRALAGRWLGTIHVATASAGLLPNLPHRRPEHYLELLRSARKAILRNRDNAALTTDDLARLNATLSQFDLLESLWGRVKEVCAAVPQTLVHGDFTRRNVHVRNGQDGLTFLSFDWEDAGWGVPAADLAQFLGAPEVNSVSPDITTYWSVVRQRWPDLDVKDIRQLAEVGTIFQGLVRFNWGSWSLERKYSRWLEPFTHFLGVFQARLSEAIKRLDGKTKIVQTVPSLFPDQTSTGSLDRIRTG